MISTAFLLLPFFRLGTCGSKSVSDGSMRGVRSERELLFIEMDGVPSEPCYCSTVAPGADHTDNANTVVLITKP